MKHGKGINDLDDKSSGMEIFMDDAFTKINPTDPLILAMRKRRKNGVYFQQNKKRRRPRKRKMSR